jgi:hypothetical protein
MAVYHSRNIQSVIPVPTPLEQRKSRKAGVGLGVFWNGSAANSVELGKNPDDANWFIQPVDRKFIMEHYWVLCGPNRRRLTTKASNLRRVGVRLLYHYRGKWLKLQGAD